MRMSDSLLLLFYYHCPPRNIRKYKWSFIFAWITGVKERSRPLITWRLRTQKEMGTLPPPHCKSRDDGSLPHFEAECTPSSPALQHPWLESTFPSYKIKHCEHFSQSNIPKHGYSMLRKKTPGMFTLPELKGQRGPALVLARLPIPEVSLDISEREASSWLNLQHQSKSRCTLWEY